MSDRTYKHLQKKTLIFKTISLYSVFIACISSCADVYWSAMSLPEVHLKTHMRHTRDSTENQ